MKVYLVGGAVRDELMGMESNDRDYVVVGATEADMLARGYKKVGADFPVFMDEKGDQYALARKERKVAAGYLGFETTFDPSVSLKDDLLRRDLTINAIAKDIETGEIVDPIDGYTDLKNGVLCHVSDAFAEDPLRVIRLARFYARWPDFDINFSTIELCKKIVASGEMNELSDERYYAELDKMFSTCVRPDRFFTALMAMNVLVPVAFMHDKQAALRFDVKFLDDLFGQMQCDLHTILAFAKEVRRCAAVERLPFYIAHVAENSAQKSAAIPTNVKKLTQAVRKLRETKPTAEGVYQLLHSVRGFDEQAPTANDLIQVMHLAEAVGDEWPLEAQRLFTARAFAQHVKADRFMHLTGPEIGRAMAAARVDTIRNVIGA